VPTILQEILTLLYHRVTEYLDDDSDDNDDDDR